MTAPIRRLGDLEARVMNLLWDALRPMSVRAVLAEVNRDRDLAYTTVMTVLDKLHSKGWVERGLAGRAYMYAPTASREQYTAMLMAEAMTVSQDRRAAFAHFVEQMDPEALVALRDAVDRRRRS